MAYEKLQKALGRTIRAERHRQGYRSQESLAYAAELHPNYIGAIERGERNVSLQNLLRISAALEMSVSRLLQHAEALAESESRE